MSVLASFFLFKASDRGEVIEAAQAQSDAISKNRGRPPDPDPFWEFIHAHTKELDDFPFSGSILVDMFSIKPELSEADGKLSDTLCKIMDSTFIFYGPQEASDAIHILDTIDLSDGAVRQFLEEEGWTEEYEDAGAIFREAAAHFRSWLTTVTDGYTGLLSIG